MQVRGSTIALGVVIGVVLYFVTRELLFLLTLAAFIVVGIGIAAVVRRR
jgi:hypothetical protein